MSTGAPAEFHQVGDEQPTDVSRYLSAIRRGAWLIVLIVVPLTHGIEAARLVAEGTSLGSVDGLILRELLVGAGYAAAAYLLFRTFEAAGRRTASFDNY